MRQLVQPSRPRELSLQVPITLPDHGPTGDLIVFTASSTIRFFTPPLHLGIVLQAHRLCILPVSLTPPNTHREAGGSSGVSSHNYISRVFYRNIPGGPPPAPLPTYAKGDTDCDMTSCPAGYVHVTDAATCATVAASRMVTASTEYGSGSWTDWGSYCFYSVEWDKIFYTSSSSGDCSSSTQAMYPVCKLDSA